jgi:TonB family protein
MLKSEVESLRVSSRRRCLVTLSQLVIIVFLSVVASVAQVQIQEPSSKERKLITRVEPEYPETLKRLYIGGVVRVEVEVEPSGVVKSTKLLGGSPILGQSTMKAIKQWRYVPAASEETLIVKIEFDSHR